MATFNELIHSEKPVLVDFFAEQCGPCKLMSTVLVDVSARIGSKARILKVDVDKNRTVVQKYKVSSVPTLLVFKRGEIQWRGSGLVNADRLADILYLFS